MKRAVSPIAAPLPLFVSSEVKQLEAERKRLAEALKRMREQHRHGTIQRTEFRLRDVTSRILATALGKEFH